MPFLYDVWNVKLQLYAKGLVWSRGGKHFSKTFSIFYMLNGKNRVFNPYFSIGTCPMRKLLLWISRGLNLIIFFIEKISFSLKLFSGHFYGQSFIKTVRGPSYGDSLGHGNESLFKWSWSHEQDGRGPYMIKPF